MSEYNVLLKGTYNYPQKNDFVAVKHYMIVETQGDFNGLLLRFSNSLNESVTGLKINIIEYDAEGNIIYERKEEFNGLEGLSNSSFTLGKYIEVDKKCADFKIDILKVVCGDYSYTVKKRDVISVNYDKATDNSKLNKKALFKQMYASKQSVQARKLNFTPMLLCFAIIAVGVMSLISYLTIHYTANPEGYFIEENYKYTILSDTTVTVSQYAGSKAEVVDLVVPEEVNGYKVVGIDNNAFLAYDSLKTVVAPAVTKLGSNAFNGCTQLVSIEAPITDIGDDCFKGCTKLAEIDNKGIKTVGVSAFENCLALTSINLNGIISIGDKAFYGCKLLETSISSDGAKYVGANAFENCSKLQSITLTGLETLSIGQSAFKNCTALKNVQITQEYTCSTSKEEFLTGDYFVEKLSLSSIKNTLADLFGTTSTKLALKELSVASMPAIPDLFCDVLIKKEYTSISPELTSVNIGNLGSYEVGKYAFNGCTKLATISLSGAITKISDAAFMGTAITSFDGSELVTIGKNAFAQCKELATINLTDKVTSIESAAFNGCEALASIYISKNLTIINQYVFAGCINLVTVEMNVTESKLDDIKEYAFESCQSIKEIKLAKGLRTVRKYAFTRCNNIEKVYLPAGAYVDTTGNGNTWYENHKYETVY